MLNWNDCDYCNGVRPFWWICYENYGTEGYILKCDITKFFYNINHEKLKEIIAYYFKDKNIQLENV